MAKFIAFIIFIIVIVRLATLEYAPCATSISYKLGTIDARFNLSAEQLRVYTESASQIWGDYEGVPLFTYDQESKLTINLTYDERQELSNTIEDLDTNIDNENSVMKPKVDEYNRRTSAFEARLAKLNAEIQYWNSQGGAPEEEFERLKREQQEIQQEANVLNSMAAELNKSASSFNEKVREFNSTIKEFNQTISQKPEEGLYDPQNNRIDIYFNTDPDGLIHTLAHELGHARGVDHINDEMAIMYPYSTKTTMLSDGDKVQLSAACKRHTYAQLFLIRLPLWIERIQSEINKRFAFTPQFVIS